jgi:hypothetical protein
MRELPPTLGSSVGAAGGEGAAAEEEEDALAALLGSDFAAEPSSGSVSASVAATGSTQPDIQRLAGAMAAAGVLLPKPLPNSTPSSSSCLGASTVSGSASSGHASGGEGAVGAAACRPGAQLAAALERQRSALACDDIGCLAAVTFCFMHQPGAPIGAGQGRAPLVGERSTARV